jgi:hypothetical protein
MIDMSTINPNIIDEIFEIKKETRMDLKEAQDMIDEVEKRIAIKKIEIAKHDKLCRENGTLDRLIIKGKNDKEREQCEQVVFEKENQELNDLRDIFKIRKLEDELADLAIKRIDYRLRNEGV